MTPAKLNSQRVTEAAALRSDVDVNLKKGALWAPFFFVPWVDRLIFFSVRESTDVR